MTWKTGDQPEKALTLPTGSYYANVFGLNVQQSVNPEHVLAAASAVNDANVVVTAATQAGILVAAQRAGVAFQDWGTLDLL